MMAAKRTLFKADQLQDETETNLQKLSELKSGRTADCYVLLSDKQRAETRDGKPYYRCQFRDLHRIATAMIWSDSSWFEVCEEDWTPGEFYFVRCRYSENQYGPQIDLQRIREVNDEDREAGFNPADYLPQSRFDSEAMFQELCGIVSNEIEDQPLQ